MSNSKTLPLKPLKDNKFKIFNEKCILKKLDQRLYKIINFIKKRYNHRQNIKKFFWKLLIIMHLKILKTPGEIKYLIWIKTPEKSLGYW